MVAGAIGRVPEKWNDPKGTLIEGVGPGGGG